MQKRRRAFESSLIEYAAQELIRKMATTNVFAQETSAAQRLMDMQDHSTKRRLKDKIIAAMNRKIPQLRRQCNYYAAREKHVNWFTQHANEIQMKAEELEHAKKNTR